MSYLPTQAEAKTWIAKHVHKSVNPDRKYGSQCMDEIVQYCLDLFNWHPYGNAKDLWTQKLPKGWKRIKNSPSFVPQAGDIPVWKPAAWNGYYGHCGIATGKGNTSYFQSLDQNWVNASDNGSPAEYVNHGYVGTYAIYGVLRPVWRKVVPRAVRLSKPKDFAAKLSTTNVWDLNTNPYFTPGRTMKKGTKFTAYAYIKFNGSTYYQTQSDYNKDNKYGVNSVDLTTYVPPKPPVVTKPPVVNPDPSKGSMDYAKENNALLKTLVDMVKQILSVFNFKK